MRDWREETAAAAFRSLNYALGDTINPLRPVEADVNSLIYLLFRGTTDGWPCPGRHDLKQMSLHRSSTCE